MKKKDFNIIIAGVGGQGIITLLKILSEAALIDGYDIKGSELHGLSQRGGSVLAHLRFGEKISSPLVSLGKADLIIALEMSEALRRICFSGDKTISLINSKFIHYFGGSSQKQVLAEIKKIKNKTYLVEASDICKQKIGKEVLAGVYLVCFAVLKGLIPLSQESILLAIEKTVRKKYLAINKKTFKLALKNI